MKDIATLRLGRTIAAPRSNVFQAWTTAELLQKWFSPGAMSVDSVEIDPRAGGSFHIAMSGNNGTSCVSAAVAGSFLEFVPNERLTFTWGWPGDSTPQTCVAVEFTDAVPTGTLVTVVHEGFVSQSDFDRHEHGWNGCFDKLAALTKGTKVGRGLTRSLFLRASQTKVFDALATVQGLKSWWTPLVTGDPCSNGELRFRFRSREEEIVMRVDEADPVGKVRWTCLIHTNLAEWSNTVMLFTISALTSEVTELSFKHEGLVPELKCYRHCEIGWDHFLDSLKSLLENGVGKPYGADTLSELDFKSQILPASLRADTA